MAVGHTACCPKFILKERGPRPAPAPGPGKPLVSGGGGSGPDSDSHLETVGAKFSLARALCSLLTCCWPGSAATAAGPFCSSNTQGHVHIRALEYGSLHLECSPPPPKTASLVQGHHTLHMYGLKATSSEDLPQLPHSLGAGGAMTTRMGCFWPGWGRATAFVFCGCKTDHPRS